MKEGEYLLKVKLEEEESALVKNRCSHTTVSTPGGC